jgi:hypothetical protein
MAAKLSPTAVSALWIAASRGPLKVYRQGWDATGLGQGHSTGTIMALGRRGLLDITGERKGRMATITAAGRQAIVNMGVD